MKIDIYTSSKCGNKYLSIPKGTKLDDLNLSDSIDEDLLTLSPFMTRLDVEQGLEHNALDQDDILAQIEEQGYAVHGAKRQISLS